MVTFSQLSPIWNQVVSTAQIVVTWVGLGLEDQTFHQNLHHHPDGAVRQGNHLSEDPGSETNHTSCQSLRCLRRRPCGHTVTAPCPLSPLLDWRLVLEDNSSWVSWVSSYLKIKALTSLCSGLPLKEYLYSDYPVVTIKRGRVSLKAERRHFSTKE